MGYHRVDSSDTINRVLIVEDDPNAARAISQFLLHNEYNVQTVEDGNSALKIVQEDKRVNIVVADVQLPELDGLHLIERIAKMRQNGRVLCTIVMSNYADLVVAQRAIRAGAIDFLAKPISFLDLERALDRANSEFQRNSDIMDGTHSFVMSKMDTVRSAVLSLGGHIDAYFQSAFSAGVTVGETGFTPDIAFALLCEIRRTNHKILPDQLFGNSCWNMLIDLLEAEKKGKRISITSLCYGSGEPTTTALRRINDLCESGYIMRKPDSNDRRRIIISLTDEGRNLLNAVVCNICQFFDEALSSA